MPKYEPTYAAFEGDAPSPKIDPFAPPYSYTLTRFAPYNSDKLPDYLGLVAMAAESRVRNWIEGNC